MLKVFEGLSYTKAGKTEYMPYSIVAHFMRGSRGIRNENKKYN